MSEKERVSHEHLLENGGDDASNGMPESSTDEQWTGRELITLAMINSIEEKTEEKEELERVRAEIEREAGLEMDWEHGMVADKGEVGKKEEERVRVEMQGEADMKVDWEHGMVADKGEVGKMRQWRRGAEVRSYEEDADVVAEDSRLDPAALDLEVQRDRELVWPVKQRVMSMKTAMGPDLTINVLGWVRLITVGGILRGMLGDVPLSMRREQSHFIV